MVVFGGKVHPLDKKNFIDRKKRISSGKNQQKTRGFGGQVSTEERGQDHRAFGGSRGRKRSEGSSGEQARSISQKPRRRNLREIATRWKGLRERSRKVTQKKSDHLVRQMGNSVAKGSLTPTFDSNKPD